MVSHAVPFWWRIVVSEETAVVQVTEVLLVAPVVHVILRSVQHSVLRWTESRPWLPQVIANGNRRLKGMGVPPTDAAALRLWADFWAVALSHSLGLLLCLPAVTGGWGLPPSVPAILGRHSAILECAWELGDITLRLYRRFRLPQGCLEQPAPLLGLVILHHTMGLGIAVPMTVFFGDIPIFFEMVAMLQSTSLIIVLLSQWGQTLDVSRPRELAQMVGSSVLLIGVLLYSRVIWYWQMCLKLLEMAALTGVPGLWTAGLVASVGLGLANAAYLVDAVARLAKFGPSYLSHLIGHRKLLED